MASKEREKERNSVYFSCLLLIPSTFSSFSSLSGSLCLFNRTYNLDKKLFIICVCVCDFVCIYAHACVYENVCCCCSFFFLCFSHLLYFQVFRLHLLHHISLNGKKCYKHFLFVCKHFLLSASIHGCRTICLFVCVFLYPYPK